MHSIPLSSKCTKRNYIKQEIAIRQAAKIQAATHLLNVNPNITVYKGKTMENMTFEEII